MFSSMLSKIPLLSFQKPTDSSLFEEFSQKLEILMISPESDVIKQGDDPNEKMYFIQKGKFKV